MNQVIKKFSHKDFSLDYFEDAHQIDGAEFQKVINTRRSVRVFEDTPIPEDIVNICLENALRAPNSSNLQPWEFYRITNQEKKDGIVKACLSQVAAKTAAEIFVVVARTRTWKKHSREMAEIFEGGDDKLSKKMYNYYKKLAPFVYSQGPLSVFGLLKRLIYFVRGITTPVIRFPVSNTDMKLWAVKSTALAAENLMLSFRAYGYDTCPMEGFDSKRIKKILKLPGDGTIIMVISAGKRAKGGIVGPCIRFDSSRYIKEV